MAEVADGGADTGMTDPATWEASQEEARLRECQTIFLQYDKNRSGALEFDELRSALGDLGILVRTTCWLHAWALGRLTLLESGCSMLSTGGACCWPQAAAQLKQLGHAGGSEANRD